jgi:ankyrin repeat protein
LGNAQIARYLMVSGANAKVRTDVMATASGGDTPLHMAAAYGHLDLAKLLLSNGADPNAANGLGMSPLHFAAMAGKHEVVEQLVSSGANAAQLSVSNRTPAHLASENGFREVAAFLLNHSGPPIVVSALPVAPLLVLLC